MDPLATIRDLSELPTSQLFQLAEQAESALDYASAEEYYQAAHNREPHNDLVTMCLAHVLKKNNKIKVAKRTLEKSIADHTQGTYRRYFELGELYDGVKSIKIFEDGIAVAEGRLNALVNTAQASAQPAFGQTFTPLPPGYVLPPWHQANRLPMPQNEEMVELYTDLAKGYSCVAQVCLTDLLDEKEAEGKCRHSLSRALQFDPFCVDLHLQLANYLLYTNDDMGAKKSLEVISHVALEREIECEQQSLIQAARYYIELDDFKGSKKLLEKVYEQQNNELQLVYLMAYCEFKLERYAQCQELMEEYQQGLKNGQQPDSELAQAMAEMVEEFRKKKVSGGLEETGEDQEDDWMDVESADEEEYSEDEAMN